MAVEEGSFDYRNIMSPAVDEERRLAKKEAILKALLSVGNNQQIPLQHYGLANGFADVLKAGVGAYKGGQIADARITNQQNERTRQKGLFEKLQGGWNDKNLLTQMAQESGPVGELAQERLKAFSKSYSPVGPIAGAPGMVGQTQVETGETNLTKLPTASENSPGGGGSPVTPVTIKDPKDPTGEATIVVDGRTGRKIGDGPKLTETGKSSHQKRLDLPQARLRTDSIVQNVDKLRTAITELRNDPGLPNITGTIAGRTPNITNTATGAQSKLNSIKSQIFVSALQAMREASKTGGAVGNVSDREGDKLENTISALDQAQGTSDFEVQLDKALIQLEMSKTLIQRAFEEEYSGLDAGEESKTINGVTYTKRNGRWYSQ